jgi:hypothetical protein
VSTSKQMYAEILSAVSTLTTLPLVLNFFLWRPSSPTSEKNCLLPIICQPVCSSADVCIPRTLLSSKQTDEENAGSVHGKQGADGVELGGKDLEHDECK